MDANRQNFNQQNSQQNFNQQNVRPPQPDPRFSQPPVTYNHNMQIFLENMKKKYNFTLLFVLSIIEILCSSICGIISLVFVNKMKDAFIVGDYFNADKYAKYSRVALIVGGVLFGLLIIFMIIYIIIMITVFSTYIQNTPHQFYY